MKRNNYYDVTDWQVGNPYTDIGEVINSIIADIKNRQKDTNVNDGGKPGAVIYIPSGDYHLKTQVKIDISYLKIRDQDMDLCLQVSDIMCQKNSGRIFMTSGRAVAGFW